MIINKENCEPYKYNENYYVSRSGKIYSIYVIGGRGSIDINNPHLLSYGQDADGYYRVVLSLYGAKKYIKVHTVIAEQFIGDIPDGMVVNHKDGNIHNNDVSNLEIVTVKENTQHAHRTGLTSSEKPVNVLHNGKVYNFNSQKECIEYFPDLSRYYLEQLRNGEIKYSMILFKKRNPGSRVGIIDAYYNGELYMSYDNMQEADEYWGKSRGATSSALKFNEHRSKINQYHVSF